MNIMSLKSGIVLFVVFLICHSSHPVLGEEIKGPIKFGLTLSGGGIRAAAFSYGVMRGLEEIFLCVNED